MSAGVVLRSRSEPETEAIAARLARSLRAGDLVALRGDLGAGKTRFVRGLVTGLGGNAGLVSSPTFVLVNHYRLPVGSAASELVHIDAYRVRGAEELESIGWDGLLAGRGIVALEWPERIEAALPKARFEVSIEHTGVHERRLSVAFPGGRAVDLGR